MNNFYFDLIEEWFFISCIPKLIHIITWNKIFVILFGEYILVPFIDDIIKIWICINVCSLVISIYLFWANQSYEYLSNFWIIRNIIS